VEFDWDEANVEHIARHGVIPDEAEQAVLSAERITLVVRVVAGERRATIMGPTENSRLLLVVTTVRGRRVRIVTARDASDHERKGYRRRLRR
jgi:uncharacterized DUF497 family protein